MASDIMRHIVVVGAGAAGLTAAGVLRRRGHTGDITVVGDEQYAPYDRPPLSKQVLVGSWDADRIRLRAAPELEAADATWRLGEMATGLDIERRVLHTDRGRTIAWDGLVLATGVRPRSLPAPSFSNVYTLRTLGDAFAIRDALAGARAVVVIGAGVLGCEIASSVRSLGHEVTIVDAASTPMLRHLGPDLGAEIAQRHTLHGVGLRLGVGVASLDGGERAEGVVLADGTRVDADLVIVAIGAVLDLGWLKGSGLGLGDGVLCDAGLRAAPGVVAAGDVASWDNILFGRRMRVEHRFNATEQATVAATNLLGGDLVHDAVPYFWSEQLGLRLQVFGDPSRAVRTEIIEGELATDRFAAALYDADDALTACVSWNLPKLGPALRQRVLDACISRTNRMMCRNPLV